MHVKLRQLLHVRLHAHTDSYSSCSKHSAVFLFLEWKGGGEDLKRRYESLMYEGRMAKKMGVGKVLEYSDTDMKGGRRQIGFC